MSSNDVAVSVRGLSKSYTIAHNVEKHSTMGEALLHRARNPLHRAEKETFWALKDVEFDIKQGDVVGIIGRNGAGKSTLLKVLSQITEPTTGEINLYGRVGSLLEVGTGFHPELTGRENIFLNGAILGMRRKEIERQFDAIVEFAEVEKFLDTPVKRYSSGMYVRLAFAVAAHLNPEILIIDEVLAVGDAEFQKKCLGKMKSVSREEGKTVLFVSHNINAISNLCNSALLMTKGQMTLQADVDSVLRQYVFTTDASHTVDLTEHPHRSLSYSPVFQSLEMTDAEDVSTVCFAPDSQIRLKFEVKSDQTIKFPRIGIGVTNSRGERIFAVATFLGDAALPSITGRQKIVCTFKLPPLVAGRYSLDIGISDGVSDFIDAIFTAATLEVVENNYLGMTQSNFNEMGYIMVRSQWDTVR